MAGVGLDGAGYGNIVPREVQFIVAVQGYFEGGKDELVHPEGGVAYVALPVQDFQGEAAVAEALGNGEFARHGAVGVGLEGKLFKVVTLGIPEDGGEFLAFQGLELLHGIA